MVLGHIGTVGTRQDMDGVTVSRVSIQTWPGRPCHANNGVPPRGYSKFARQHLTPGAESWARENSDGQLPNGHPAILPNVLPASLHLTLDRATVTVP